MKRLIQLTQTGGDAVYINPDHIIKVEPQPAGLKGNAKLFLSMGEHVVVDQTPAQVAEATNSADSAASADGRGAL